MTSYEEQGQTPPGEPRFIYVAKISEEDENKAAGGPPSPKPRFRPRAQPRRQRQVEALSSISGNLAANVPDEDYAYAANAMYQDSGYRYQMMMQRQAMMMAARGGGARPPAPNPAPSFIPST